MLCVIGRVYNNNNNLIRNIKILIYDREAEADCLSYFNKLKNEEIIHYTSIYKIKHNRQKLYIRKKLISISTYIGKNEYIKTDSNWLYWHKHSEIQFNYNTIILRYLH